MWKGVVVCVEGWCGVCGRGGCVVYGVWKGGVVCVEGWCGVCGRIV